MLRLAARPKPCSIYIYRRFRNIQINVGVAETLHVLVNLYGPQQKRAINTIINTIINNIIKNPFSGRIRPETSLFGADPSGKITFRRGSGQTNHFWARIWPEK